MTHTARRNPRTPPLRVRLGTVVAVLVTSVVLALTGCTPTSGAGASPTGVATVAAVHSWFTVTVDGAKRRFLVVAPKHAEGETLPAVIALHGAGGSAQMFADSTSFAADATGGAFIAVFPDGSPQTSDTYVWNAGSCCGKAVENDVDDIGFLKTVMAQLTAKHDVNKDRIYFAGFSNGGMMAYRAACDLGSSVAGIAVVSGALNVTSCQSGSTMPVLIIHGTADEVVPYNGGNPIPALSYGLKPWTNESVAQAVTAWTDRDGCTADPIKSMNGTVVEELYGGCAKGSYIDVFSITGGGHTWPADPAVLDAADLIERAFLTATEPTAG
ncbi:PHB depolymerase family esterase [Glaciihabitans sp. dw_435]|uniref:alpha/beta hydrolase family esterase n=1 Tax=Glaciihabitans sp. dw_435 TaxID=2720081 RepID=UPI001BD417D0|nr:PHB depolymerase family esterase [Glaciihabitans sp. dw_435]